MHQRTKKGFTLIELLIVIAIIGLLATLAIVSLTSAQRKARDTKRVADVKQIQNAVELFYSESPTAQYPISTDTVNETWAELGVATAAPGTPTGIGNYITNTPVDPQNTGSYVYTYGSNTAGTEYFVGAKLEDTAHAALNGDDDTNYVVGTTSGWNAGVDFVKSNDTAASDLTTFDCGTSVLDATGGVYCASE